MADGTFIPSASGQRRQYVPRAGDWTCPRCRLSVFASRIVCFRCGAPRPRATPTAAASNERSLPTFCEFPSAAGSLVEDLAVGITVGTLNLLHPAYAFKYSEPEGLDATGRSNWPARVQAIARVLLNHRLDVYLLQEVGPAELEDLRALLGQAYDVTYALHPARGSHRPDGTFAGGDGVAVLLRLGCLAPALDPPDAPGLSRAPVHCGWRTAPQVPYMASAVVCAKHVQTGTRVLVVSVHFYDKKAHAPQQTLLQALEERQFGLGCHTAIWGGDCNRSYTPGQAVGGFACAPTARPTRHASGKAIDWIFARGRQQPGESQLVPRRTHATEAFVRSTWEARPLLSDHFGEAVFVPLR